MTPVLVFDVNETLLDVSALDPRFEHYFGDAAVRRQWFDYALRLAFVSTITGPYSDFGTILRGALRVMEQKHRQPLSPEQRFEIVDGMSKLPPHPDASEALSRLRDAGARLIALTNSTSTVAGKQLENAGLARFFEKIFSADAVKRLKPAPEPYRMVAERLSVKPEMLCMVAAHGWDVTGAIRAGLNATFVARPGQFLDPVSARPDVVVTDLRDLARHYPGQNRAA